MKKSMITVDHSTCNRFLVITTPPGMTRKNLGFERDAARALIADQLAVFFVPLAGRAATPARAFRACPGAGGAEMNHIFQILRQWFCTNCGWQGYTDLHYCPRCKEEELTSP